MSVFAAIAVFATSIASAALAGENRQLAEWPTSASETEPAAADAVGAGDGDATSGPSVSFTASPIAPFLGVFESALEFRTGENSGLGIIAGLGSYDRHFLSGLGAQINFYTGAFEGLHVAPQLLFVGYRKYTYVSAGALAGYKGIAGGFTFVAQLGMHYVDRVARLDRGDVGPVGAIRIGYSR